MTDTPKKTGPSMAKGKSKQDYETPPEFMDAVQNRFGPIIWDLAAHAGNTKHKDYFDIEKNSLIQPWHQIGNGWLWLNPEFNDITTWSAKCASEVKLGAKILFLTPASVGANWYWKNVEPVSVGQALTSRIQFVGADDPYPKDLMLSVFAHGLRGFQQWDWKVKRLPK